MFWTCTEVPLRAGCHQHAEGDGVLLDGPTPEQEEAKPLCSASLDNILPIYWELAALTRKMIFKGDQLYWSYL